MESFGYNSYIYDFSAGGVPTDFGTAQLPLSMPEFYNYDVSMPVFNAEPSSFSNQSENYGAVYSEPVGNLFDSNCYFGTFGADAAVMPMPSFWDFFRMQLPLPLFDLAAFSLPQITLPTPVRKPASAQNKVRQNPFSLNFDTTVKFDSVSAAGYNPMLGKKLAQEVASHVEPRSTGFCSRYVSNAMARLGIAGKREHAYKMISSLRQNPHFREVDASSVDLKKLPAGCVVVYPQKSAGYSSKYGHIEITLGNGTAASDFINKKVKSSPDMKIFVPVSA